MAHAGDGGAWECLGDHSSFQDLAVWNDAGRIRIVVVSFTYLPIACSGGAIQCPVVVRGSLPNGFLRVFDPFTAALISSAPIVVGTTSMSLDVGNFGESQQRQDWGVLYGTYAAVMSGIQPFVSDEIACYGILPQLAFSANPNWLCGSCKVHGLAMTLSGFRPNVSGNCNAPFGVPVPPGSRLITPVVVGGIRQSAGSPLCSDAGYTDHRYLGCDIQGGPNNILTQRNNLPHPTTLSRLQRTMAMDAVPLSNHPQSPFYSVVNDPCVATRFYWTSRCCYLDATPGNFCPDCMNPGTPSAFTLPDPPLPALVLDVAAIQ